MSTANAFALDGIRAVIVDLDGTMVDTALDFHAAVNHTRADFSLSPLNLEVVRRFVGKGFRHLVRSALEMDWPAESVERHFPEAQILFLKHYEAVNGEWSTLYPEVKSGLAAMSEKGLRLACVTNKQAVFAVPLLKKLGLHSYFNVIYPGDALPQMKPDPLPMVTVFNDFGLDPHEVVAIGDTTNDLDAARAAGCKVLCMSYGYHQGQPVHELDSDGIVQTLLEAAHLIR